VAALDRERERRAELETEVLEELERGDRKRALTILMQAYGDDLYRHCRQMLRDPALADDVHQTVFVQAYRDLPRFSRRSTLRTWLYGIARHRCLDALKARRRWFRRFELADAPPDGQDLRPRADEHLAAVGVASALELALDELKPKVRVAVLLRFREDMTYEEMAEVCGERPATLQARVARAMPRLRKCLQGMGVAAAAEGAP